MFLNDIKHLKKGQFVNLDLYDNAMQLRIFQMKS